MTSDREVRSRPWASQYVDSAGLSHPRKAHTMDTVWKGDPVTSVTNANCRAVRLRPLAILPR